MSNDIFVRYFGMISLWMQIFFTFLTEKKKKYVYSNFINKSRWYHPKITNENIVQKDSIKFVLANQEVQRNFGDSNEIRI